MDRAAFTADCVAAGYEVRESEIAPHQDRPAHAHDFDVRLLVLEGSLTLVLGDERRTFSVGDTCAVAAGALHEEHTGADGVRTLAGRRAALHATAA